MTGSPWSFPVVPVRGRRWKSSVSVFLDVSTTSGNLGSVGPLEKCLCLGKEPGVLKLNPRPLPWSVEKGSRGVCRSSIRSLLRE